MTGDPFAPFEFDAESARAKIAEPLNGADDGELFLEHGVSESLVWDDGRLKSASFDALRGFGLRCVSGESTGYSHTSDPSLAALVRAGETAAAAKQGRSGTLAAPPAGTNRRLYDSIDPVADPDFETKVKLLAEIDAYVRGRDPSVVQVSASIAGSRRIVGVLRADGDLKTDDRPLVRINVSVTAERDGRRETGSAGAGGRDRFETWLAPDRWKELADEALRIARVNLDAIDARAGQMDVVLGPGWPAVLLHEAVGHGLEGDFNRKGSSAFSGRIGERVAAPGVTVVDDGTIEKRRGSLTIDDEGTPSSRTVLIEDGVLKGYMQDRLNARLMGVDSTGNGRRESYAHMPMPRMTNTYMLGGKDDPDEIVASLKDGLYAVNFGGGQVDITSGKFVFQCTEAYKVEKGKVVAPIKGATLIGDGPTALTKVRG
ncbi:MAG TPA: metalloprotease TldD, partial [Alphaproteobacteria bacterium]|nr:metalloprotease TldD [Alphaproteobacteria bacterium]